MSLRRFHGTVLLIAQKLSILGVQLNALYGCNGNRFSDTINQTLFGKEFVKLVKQSG